MTQTNDLHSRRLGDLVAYVQNVVDEVNDYLRSGQNDPRQKQALMGKQAASIKALQQAMDMQKDIMDQLDRGEELPSRRATDPNRGKPNLTAVESDHPLGEFMDLDTIENFDTFLDDLRSRSGMTRPARNRAKD